MIVIFTDPHMLPAFSLNTVERGDRARPPIYWSKKVVDADSMFAPLRFYVASKLSFQNSELFKSPQPSERRVALQHLSAYA